MEDENKEKVTELDRDLERHKEAIGKLNDKLQKTTEMLNRARAQASSGTPKASSGGATSEEMVKLQDKID